MGEVIKVDFKQGLSDRQQNHWMNQLEFAERAVEVAKRVLGLLPVELGVAPYDDFHDVFPEDDAS